MCASASARLSTRSASSSARRFCRSASASASLIDAVALLDRLRDRVVRADHLRRRVQVVEREAVERDADAAGRERVEPLAEPVERVAFQVGAADREHFLEPLTRDQFAQHRFGRRTDHAVRVADAEQELPRVGDVVADRREDLDQIAVAGDHHGFVGEPGDAVGVAAGPGVAADATALLCAASRELFVGERAEADFDGAHFVRAGCG